jgi:hypothetical protein
MCSTIETRSVRMRFPRSDLLVSSRLSNIVFPSQTAREG